jgi:hypothetical protein
MAWCPTPKSLLIKARKLADNGWVECEVKDLRPGDVFRAVFLDTYLNPLTHEPDDDVVALVTDFPVKNVNNCNGSLMGEVGWGVPLELFESMDALKRKGLS